MNYKEAYGFGLAELEKSGIPNATYDARILLEYCCNTNHNDLLVHGDRVLSENEKNRYTKLINERSKHIPLQYITGTQEFMGITFKVTPSVLIPRQDTEILVESVMKNIHDGMTILDMCTGSGCILLSLLHYSNDCIGVGVDISEDAIKVAEENAFNLGIKACFLQSDLFAELEGKFDMIVSNPPYIKSKVIHTLMNEVKDYEPMLALDGNEDGIYFYHRIIKEAKKHLNRGGQLFFEIGYDQKEVVEDYMKQEGYIEVSTIKDFAGLDRVVLGTFLEEVYV
ncbi:MAG TPA: peptide chain release factor N(5)-glutamine methyltransferase [Lachnospiraceae bacterium]|nr:peptide chain release factor N(5)-glutamine methyltransferase [Lachnospiraceae bacterium]